MCDDCWAGADRPSEWTPETGRFIELVNVLYSTYPTGGPLHTVLDDWNLDGTIAPYYVGEADYEIGAIDGSALTLHEACDEIATILNGWTLPQRYSAMAFVNDYATPPTVVYAVGGTGVATFTPGAARCDSLDGTFKRHGFPGEGDSCWCGEVRR